MQTNSVKGKSMKNRNPQTVLKCYFRHEIEVQSYEKFSHPVMLTSKKKIEKLELLFLSPSLFSLMECYQGENWLKDRLLKREEKELLVILFKSSR